MLATKLWRKYYSMKQDDQPKQQSTVSTTNRARTWLLGSGITLLLLIVAALLILPQLVDSTSIKQKIQAAVTDPHSAQANLQAKLSEMSIYRNDHQETVKGPMITADVDYHPEQLQVHQIDHQGPAFRCQHGLRPQEGATRFQVYRQTTV
jgi:hypothetical protein